MATRGGYAQQSLLATAKAQQMQAQAVAYIEAQYAREDTNNFSILDMGIDTLADMIDKATKDGTLEALNARLAQQILQVLAQGAPDGRTA